MSAFDAVMRGLQGGSDLKMDVMKKDPASGMLINASDREVNSIGTKASIATNAQLLKNLPPHEKFEWAIEVKEYANGLYAKGDYEQAMIKYAECLAATDFGTTPTPCAAIQKQVVIEDSTTSDVDDDKHRNDTGTGISPDTVECSFGSSSNVDSVVIPVLCNLAACAIQLKQWPKAVQLCQQAIQLRPDCVKALYRQGLALVQAGEFERAMLCLEESSRLLHLEALTDGDTGIDKDGDGDGKGRDKDIDNVRDEDKDKDIDIDKNWGRVVINSDNDNDQHHKAGAAGALLAKEVSKSNSDSLITSSAPNATTAPTPTFLQLQKVAHAMALAKAGMKRERQALRKQKEALAKGFAARSSNDSGSSSSTGSCRGSSGDSAVTCKEPISDSVKLMSLVELAQFAVHYFFTLVLSIVGWAFPSTSSSSSSTSSDDK